NESDNQYTKTITVYAPPVLTNPPAGFLIASTYTATFTAGASGSFPLTYRWFKNGSIIGGATGSALTLTNVNMNTAGNYSVTVSNAGGSVSSSPPAVLMVEPALAVFTLAGQAGVLTNIDGFGTNAGFEEPTGIAVDGGGNAYVVDSEANNIRKI